MASRAPAERKSSGPECSPAPSQYRESTRVRPALKVSQPGDSAEREAEITARKVVAMRGPELRPRVAARAPPTAALAPAVPVPRPTAPPASGSPPPARPADATSPELEAAIRKELAGGKGLPRDVAEFMEPRFKANFGNVRIHTDGRAENLATRLGARAFTYGRDVFFNAGQFQPDTSEGMELIAHELTHTIQQREVVQREADPFAPVDVQETTQPQVQRGIVSRALDWIADKANYIPGYRLFTVVIGLNPINMSRVERSGANILRALIEFIPGGHLIVEALDNHGVMEKGGRFIEEQFRQLGMVGSAFRDALMNFIDSLGWRDIFHLGDLWDRAKRIFTDPIGKLIDFGKGLVTGIAKLVKEAIIKPLGAWAARNIPKWNLLVGVFGKNPISDDKESPASALIGAFMELIGQKEIWENIQKGGAVGKAWQWFQTAMKGALALVLSIPGRVMDTIRSLTIFDIVTIVGAFRKIVGAFASFVGDFITWAGGTVLSLLEIIFSVVAPSVVPYLKKAGAAFKTIIKAPGRFISTLVKAGKQGFNQFKAKFVTYLRDALFKWLLGAEGAGIYFPKSFMPLELLKMGLSILGLTWANIRSKLVAATNESTVSAFEAGFEIVKKLVTEGPAAAWEELLKSLSNLKTMVVDAAIEFVKSEVVKIAIEKLLSFLTPAGAFIQAIISIYRTIMFVVNKLAEIGRLVAAFIDGLAALANGIVTTAANKVESVLATGLSLAISFLANFAGLGNIPKKVMEIIKKIRAPVDKALDRVVAWIVEQAKRVGRSILQAGVPGDPNARLQQGLGVASTAVNALRGARITRELIRPVLVGIKARYGFQSLEPVEQDGVWWVEGQINPRSRQRTRQQSRVTGLSAQQLGALLEPILQRVEALWLRELSANLSQGSREGVRRAEQSIAAGGATRGGRPSGRTEIPVTVSREQEVELLRRVSAGTVPVGAHQAGMRAELAITGGEAPGGFTYLNEAENLGTLYVVGGGDYATNIPPHVRAVVSEVRGRRLAAIRADVGVAPGARPTSEQAAAIDARLNREVLQSLSRSRQRLTRTVEPARAPGMLVARRAAEVLAETGHATPAEITHGQLNPMAFRGASGEDMNSPANQARRHRRLGALIQRLRDTAQRATVLAEPGGAQLRRIGDAVENWLRANARNATDPRAVESADRRIVDAFMQFLRQFQGGR